MLVLEFFFGVGPIVDGLVAAAVYLVVGLVESGDGIVHIFDRLVVGVYISLAAVGVGVEILLQLLEFFLFNIVVGQFGHILLRSLFVEGKCALAGVYEGRITLEWLDRIEGLEPLVRIA